MQARHMLWLALPALAGIACCGHGNMRVPENALVVRNGTVIDGTGRPPIANGLVVVHCRGQGR